MDVAKKSIDAMRQLASDVESQFTERVGVKEEDFELMAENALRDGNAGSNRVGTNKISSTCLLKHFNHKEFL